RMDGLCLARLVRAEKILGETLLVAITGHAGGGIEKQAKDAGFSHYLLKPVSVAGLLALLAESRLMLRASAEECRALTDEIAEAARRQSEIAAEAAKYLRGRPPPGSNPSTS